MQVLPRAFFQSVYKMSMTLLGQMTMKKLGGLGSGKELRQSGKQSDKKSYELRKLHRRWVHAISLVLPCGKIHTSRVPESKIDNTGQCKQECQTCTT